MADAPKKEAPKGDGWDWLWYPVVVIPLVLFLLSSLGGFDFSANPPPVATSSATDVAERTSRSILDPYQWLGRENYALGNTIINKKQVTVRTAPAGSIVGTQKKLETGRLMEGPVNQFGTTWWRVDFPQAPDGWVEYDAVSTKVGWVRTLNIVPLAYSFYQPIGYGLLFILLLTYIYYKIKLGRESRIAEKKLELRREQYAEVPRPIAQIIVEKPDVQELPGFQVEEIVPVQVAEQNARWAHIQGLIASYNPSDWRQAIIEADIILEEMLDKMAYDGTTIGDKLKNVERSDFVTLDKAWSAHKVRNQIAHGGSTFKLTREMAERTIKDYEEVFKEFYYI